VTTPHCCGHRANHRLFDDPPTLDAAGELTPVKKAEHRVPFLIDPGRGAAAMQVTSTLYVGFQLLMITL
jgi:gentisate 1,2-dioxygenase